MNELTVEIHKWIHALPDSRSCTIEYTMIFGWRVSLKDDSGLHPRWFQHNSFIMGDAIKKVLEIKDEYEKKELDRADL